MVTHRAIRRGTKKSKAVFDNAKRCVAYSLNNGFVGRDTEVQFARNYHEHDGAKMYERAPGIYVVSIHSNSWYEVHT